MDTVLLFGASFGPEMGASGTAVSQTGPGGYDSTHAVATPLDLLFP